MLIRPKHVGTVLKHGVSPHQMAQMVSFSFFKAFLVQTGGRPHPMVARFPSTLVGQRVGVLSDGGQW